MDDFMAPLATNNKLQLHISSDETKTLMHQVHIPLCDTELRVWAQTHKFALDN